MIVKNPHDPGQTKSLAEMRAEIDETVRVMRAHLKELRLVQKALYLKPPPPDPVIAGHSRTAAHMSQADKTALMRGGATPPGSRVVA
jgi:hypothetical protein